MRKKNGKKLSTQLRVSGGEITKEENRCRFLLLVSMSFCLMGGKNIKQIQRTSAREKHSENFLWRWGVYVLVCWCAGGWILRVSEVKAQERSPQPLETLPIFSPPLETPLLVPPPETPIPESLPYTLGYGDRLQIDIFNVPEYSGQNGQHQVQIDGTLNLPLIGKVSVREMTLEEAKKVIEEKYAKYLQISLVTINLLAPRPLQIAIAGEVNRPGSYTISLSTSTGNARQLATQAATVTEALKTAGGITPSADIRQVKIRRPQFQKPEQIININLWELLQNGDLRQNISLRDGDTVFVPTLTNPNPAESTQLAAANFAAANPQSINIAIVGEVARPGPYILTPEIEINSQNVLERRENKPTVGQLSMALHTVTKAIKIAGGITTAADIRQIQVRRLTRTGTEQILNVDLWKLLQAGDLTQDLLLQSGDTILVPPATDVNLEEVAEVAASSFSPETLQVNVIGEVINPGAIAIAPNTSLNQALLAAGGFNKARAQTEEVELIRLNLNGTVSRRQLKVDFSAEVNEENNPTLLNNDVIVVGRSPRAAFSDNVGTILSPFNPIFGILRFFNIFQ